MVQLPETTLEPPAPPVSASDAFRPPVLFEAPPLPPVLQPPAIPGASLPLEQAAVPTSNDRVSVARHTRKRTIWGLAVTGRKMSVGMISEYSRTSQASRDLTTEYEYYR